MYIIPQLSFLFKMEFLKEQCLLYSFLKSVRSVPAGWLGTKGTGNEASDLKDNRHATVNSHAFNASQNKLVLCYEVHYELESL